MDYGVRVVALAEAKGGDFLAVAASDGKVRIVRAPKDAVSAAPPLELVPEVIPLRAVGFTEDGGLIYALSLDTAAAGTKGSSRISVWNPATGKPGRAINFDDRAARESRDEPGRGGVSHSEPMTGTKLFLAKADAASEVVDAATGKHVRDVPVAPRTTACTVNRDGALLLRADGGELTLLEIVSGKKRWSRPVVVAAKRASSAAPTLVARCDGLRILDGDQLAVATFETLDAEGTRATEGVALIDLANGETKWTREFKDAESDGGDRVRITRVAAGRDFVACLTGFQVTVLTLASGADEGTLRLSEQNVTAIAAGQDGRSVWLGGFRGAVTLFCRGGAKMVTSTEPSPGAEPEGDGGADHDQDEAPSDELD